MRPEDVERLTVGGLLDLVAERRPEDDALVYVNRGSGRDVQLMTIGEGTSEIQRLVIARTYGIHENMGEEE